MAARPHLVGSVLDLVGSIGDGEGSLMGTFEGMFPQYHAVLGGRGLILREWDRKIGQQYAAPLRTGGLSSSNRLGTLEVLLSSWKGGEGFDIHETDTADRYRNGSGIDALSQEGALNLGAFMTAISSVTALGLNAINCMIVYKGLLMLGFSNGKVYQWDGSTLTFNYDTTVAAGIAAFMIWENYLYVATKGSAVVYRWTGATATTVWASNFTVGALGADTVSAVSGLSPHIQKGVSFGYYAANETINALVGQIANTGGTTVATNGFALLEPTCGLLISYQDKLIAVGCDTTNRFWRIYEGDDSSTIGWKVKSRIDGGYITAGCVVQSGTEEVLYLGDAVGGRIWKYDGDLKLLRQLATDKTPYTANILGMCAWRGYLIVTIVDLDGTLAVWRFDGNKSWDRITTALSGTTPGPVASYNDRLHVATNTTGQARLYKADGTFISNGYAESALINADLAGTGKLWKGVTVSHTALVSGQSVQIQYRTEDAGAWITLGTNSMVASTEASFDFPGTITAKLIAFKILLAGTAGSSSPLTLYEMTIQYVPAPGVLRDWSMTVVMSGTNSRPRKRLDGTDEPLTGEQLSDEMWKMVIANASLGYLDVDRGAYTVRIADWTETTPSGVREVNAMTDGWVFEGKLRLQEV